MNERPLSSSTVHEVSPEQDWRRAGLFLRNFLKHPLMLGSAIPSSRFLISRVLDRIDWHRVRNVVEYGPGVGTFTRQILERMSPEAQLVAIELNRDFVDFLRRAEPDRRLMVAHGSAADVRRILHRHGISSADCILSGIPYTVLSRKIRQKILAESKAALSPHGTFVVYQYTRAVLPDLQRTFPAIEQDFELLNILPARLFYCTHRNADEPQYCPAA